MEISETLKMTELIIKTKCIMSTNLASCHFFFTLAFKCGLMYA